METLELVVGGEVNEPGLSGSLVVSQLVRGSNVVVSEPAVRLVMALCGEKESSLPFRASILGSLSVHPRRPVRSFHRVSPAQRSPLNAIPRSDDSCAT